MEPLFGYDLVNGVLIENHTEADLVRFMTEVYIGKKSEPPRHMILSIIKYRNNEITADEAKKLAYTHKYITMYYAALAKAKMKAWQNEHPEDIPPRKQPTRPQKPPKTPDVAKEIASEPVVPRELYEAAQAKLAARVPNDNGTPEAWCNTVQICEHLGVCRDTLIQWIIKKGLPGYKVGREWRFKKSEVDEWLNTAGEKELSYQRLFAMLRDRHLTRKQFAVMAGLSQATLTKMSTDGTAINTNVLDKICSTLKCKIGDIVMMVPGDIE